MKNNLTYYSMIILMILFLIIPYDVNNIFGFIPIRLLLNCTFILIFFIEKIFFKKKYKKMNKKILILYVLFIFFASLSLFFTTSIMTTIYTLLKFISYGLVFYIIYVSNFSKEQYLKVIKLFLFISFGIMIYGIITYIFNFNLNYNGIYKYEGAVGRIYTLFKNPIYYGIFCVIVFIVTNYFYLNVNENKKYLKIFYPVLLILTIVNLFLTYTRSEYILLLFSLCLIILLNIKNIKKIYGRLLLIVVLFIVPLFSIPGVSSVTNSAFVQIIPSSVLQIFNVNKLDYSDDDIMLDEDNDYRYTNDGVNIDDDGVTVDGSMITRGEFKKLAKRVIKDNVYFGIGFGSYKEFFNSEKNYNKYVVGKFGYPHNNYLHLLAETGIFTFVIFAIILIYIFASLIFKFLSNRRIGNLYLLISWICILLLCMYESVFYDSQIVPIYIIIATILFRYINAENKDEKKRVMFISSVGGHLTQLLSLKEMFNDYNYILITEKNDVTKNMNKTYEMAYLKYGSRNYLFKYIFIFLYNCLKSFYLFLRHYPEVIITTGTHTAVPMCYIGRLFGKKVIFIESFAKSKSPTLSGKLVYPIATTFIVQWKGMLKFYPKAKYFGGIY